MFGALRLCGDNVRKAAQLKAGAMVVLEAIGVCVRRKLRLVQMDASMDEDDRALET